MSQVILNMKSALSEMKKIKAVLDEQITKLENQKSELERDFFNKPSLANDKMMHFKELLVQILKQTQSQYCQEYTTQLS